MELTKKCQLCGNPCGDTFQLCSNCNELKKNGKIQLCEHCGKFYYVTKGGSCHLEPIAYTNEYRKNMKTPLKFRCDDGHYVRSEREQKIDNWLYHNSYLHAYEPLLTLYTEDEGLVYKIPDFYVPSRRLYIEYWGINDKGYEDNRNEKERLYKLNHIDYISIEPKDIELSDDILAFKLNYNRRKKPNFSEEKLNSLEKEKKD